MGVTALLGGAFDPPHIGHVALADAAEQGLRPTRLVVLVAERPGHRDVVAPAGARLRLAHAAFPGREVELDPYPRTIDMLRARAWEDPVLVLGADQLAAFPDWKEPEAVLELARLAVAVRPGHPRERLEAVLERLPDPARVTFLELEPLPVSSTGIRARVASGEPIDGLVPPAVARLIGELGLYRGE